MITIYDVLRRPLITEKSNYQSGKLHQYTFEVATAANKVLVKDAIETLFDVSVVRVNIINAPAKRSRRARSRRLKYS
jgi:large subunit ribosomal protein L23